MALIVQKFGGTSVADPERIQRVAARVARERRRGADVVAVVSAMGHSTDALVALASRVTRDAQRRHPRELDMLLTAGERISMALLAMAIRDAGVEAISLTGSQAAIITDETHTGARIAEIRATRVREELTKGCVVIVAGFQGVSRTREVTTLGRGGSDTTAVALAAALGADRCDIFTDVEGVFTADPRRVPHAVLLERIDYSEMVELASAGAHVMHPRAVEIGAKFRVPIRVLSSFREDDEAPGTLITRRQNDMEQLVVTGLASERGYARFILRGLPATTAAVSRVVSELGDAGISVDMLVQTDRPDGKRQLQLTVREDVVDEAVPICHRIAGELHGETIEVEKGLSRVALVGSGMVGLPGVYARAFKALVAAGIEVHAVSTSAISITVLVDEDNEDRALQQLHAAFGLGGDSQ
jgi:aspartate kinase